MSHHTIPVDLLFSWTVVSLRPFTRTLIWRCSEPCKYKVAIVCAPASRAQGCTGTQLPRHRRTGWQRYGHGECSKSGSRRGDYSLVTRGHDARPLRPGHVRKLRGENYSQLAESCGTVVFVGCIVLSCLQESRGRPLGIIATRTPD